MESSKDLRGEQMAKFKPGDKVTVHGNKEARFIRDYYGMGEVRLWSGTRHVGDIVTDYSAIKKRRK